MYAIRDFVRFSCGGLGLIFLYVAWFVYENEEKALQSRFEAWWVQFDEIRCQVVSRQTALLRVVAPKIVRYLVATFGPLPYGLNAIVVAIAACASTSLFSLAALAPNVKGEAAGFGVLASLYVPIGLICLLSVGLSAYSLLLRELMKIVSLLAVAYIILSSLLIWSLAIAGSAAHVLNSEWFMFLCWYPVVAVVGWESSIVVTLLTVAGAQKCFDYSLKSGSEWPLAGIGLALLASLTPLVLLYKFSLTLFIYSVDAHVFLLGFSVAMAIVQASVIMLGIGGCFLTLVVLMFGHRLMWPLLSRLLYTVPRYEIIKNKKLLNTAGFALLAVALSPVGVWARLLKLIGSG